MHRLSPGSFGRYSADASLAIVVILYPLGFGLHLLSAQCSAFYCGFTMRSVQYVSSSDMSVDPWTVADAVIFLDHSRTTVIRGIDIDST